MYNQTTSAIIQLETHDCPMSPRPKHLLMKTNRTGSLGGEAGALQLCGRFCQRDDLFFGRSRQPDDLFSTSDPLLGPAPAAAPVAPHWPAACFSARSALRGYLCIRAPLRRPALRGLQALRYLRYLCRAGSATARPSAYHLRPRPL